MSDIDINKGPFELTGTRTALKLMLARVRRCIDGMERAAEEGDYGAWIYGCWKMDSYREHLENSIGLQVKHLHGTYGLSVEEISKLLSDGAKAVDTTKFWGEGAEADREDTLNVLRALMNQPLTNAEVAKLSPEERADYEEYIEGRSEAHRLERGQ